MHHSRFQVAVAKLQCADRPKPLEGMVFFQSSSSCHTNRQLNGKTAKV